MTKIPYKSSLMEGDFILPHGFQGFIAHSCLGRDRGSKSTWEGILYFLVDRKQRKVAYRKWPGHDMALGTHPNCCAASNLCPNNDII